MSDETRTDSHTEETDDTVEVTPERSGTETEAPTELETETDAAIVDLEAAAEYETAAAAMREIIERQQEQIDELNDLLLDLSARVADNDGAGVCPDCHGPVVKMGGLLKRTKIECADCGRVFHRY
jgi:hypothetical protein